MARKVDKAAVAALMEQQDGVIRRQQARWFGFTKRQIAYRLANGIWVKVYPKVYVLSGCARTWRQRLVAAGFWAKRSYAFSHRCAAALWGFDRFKEEVIELTTTRNVELPPPDVVYRVTRLRWGDQTKVDGFRVTTAARTLLDLAATCAWDDVEASVNQALRQRKTSLDRLEVALERSRAPLEPLRALVNRYCGGEAVPESELESRVLALCERGGLPRPVKQKPVIIRGRLRRLDFHFPGTALAIEADGYAYHSDFDAFEDDRDRDNDLGAGGVIVQRWTWRAIHQHPDLLIERARRIIALGTQPLELAAAG